MKTTETPSGAVILYFGPQPMSFLKEAVHVCGKEAVIDPDVARMAGAMTAVGRPEHLAFLRKRLEPGALQAEREGARAGSLIPGATEWLANGERGSSSETLFTRLSGIDACKYNNKPAHPYDPDDLKRCRLMLERCPSLQEKLPDAADISPQWAALVAAWGEICATMDAESPNWRAGEGSAPKTYELIKQAVR